MRKLILSVAALGFLVASYQGALGASTTAAGQGQARLVSTNRCSLVFQFHGFAPGTAGRLEVTANGASHSLTFQVPAGSGVRAFPLHGLVGHPQSMVQVSFRIAVEGMSHIASGTVMVDCTCGGGGGGSGSGGTSGNGASGSGTSAGVTSTSTASSANAVAGQPGFAG